MACRRTLLAALPLALAILLAFGSAGALADGTCTTSTALAFEQASDGTFAACAGAVLSVAPSPATPGVPVRLDGTESSAGDGAAPIDTYEWDYGDGTTETTRAPVSSVLHTFARGRYLLHLTIYDDRGTPLDGTSFDLTVSDAPTARLAVPPGTLRPAVVYGFDASASSAPGGSVARYLWDWGDGTTSATTTPTTTHSFTDDDASRAVSVTVVNDLGLASTPATAAVTVHNELPLVQLVATPATITVGQRVSLDATGSSDPDGSVDHFEWDLDANGSFEKSTDVLTPSVSAGPFPNPGPIVLRVRVVDDSRRASVKGVVVTITGSGGAGGGAAGGGGTARSGGGGSRGGTGGSGTGTGGGTGSGAGGGGSSDAGGGAGGSAFAVGLGGNAIQTLTSVLRRGVGLTATANRRAGGTLTLQLGAGDARKLGVPGRRGKRPVTIGTLRLALNAGRTAKPAIKLTRGAAKALKRKRPRSLRVTIRGTVRAGPDSAAIVRVVLLRR
jgi:hypothetical protein